MTVAGLSHRAWKFSSVKLGELSCYFFLIRNSLWVSGYKYTNNLLSVHTEKAYFFGGNSPANFQHELTGVIFWSYLFLSWRCHAGELCFSYLIRALPVLDFDFSKFRTRRSCAMADNYFIVIDREKVFVSEEVYKTYQQMKTVRERCSQWAHQLWDVHHRNYTGRGSAMRFITAKRWRDCALCRHVLQAVYMPW